jgi:poly(A) polymerase
MTEAGLLDRVLGGVPLLASCANMIKLEAALAFEPDAIRRLGALAVSVVEDAERLREGLRLANAEYERLASMADGWWHIASDWGSQDRGSQDLDERRGRALLYQLGPELFTDRVLIAWARSPQGAADQPWRLLASLPSRWIVPTFPLKAAHFIERGVPKGPRLGAAMRAAELAWIAADFPIDTAAVEAIADAAASGVSNQ